MFSSTLMKTKIVLLLNILKNIATVTGALENFKEAKPSSFSTLNKKIKNETKYFINKLYQDEIQLNTNYCYVTEKKFHTLNNFYERV